MHRVTMLLLVFALVASAQEKVSLDKINKAPGRYTDRLISVDGFCEHWIKEGSSDVNYYMLKDNYGYSAKVRTLDENPGPGAQLSVECFVVLDPHKGSFYLDERKRSGGLAVETGMSSTIIIGITAAGLLFIILAILILMQLKKAPVQAQSRTATAPVADRTMKVNRSEELDTTYKVLPGKFIVEKGGRRVDEIKLYQVGPEPVFTIGRKEGPPSTHIRLKDPTVSKEQALLRYSDRKFMLINKSATNPTVVDNEELRQDESRELKKGSTITAGEITLRFQQ